jgi:hypothetical protein
MAFNDEGLPKDDGQLDEQSCKLLGTTALVRGINFVSLTRIFISEL